MSGYATIVADPPWQSPDPRGMGALAKSNGSTRRPHEKRPLPYPTMTVEEIAALPIGDLAADDARLFVWTTNHFLPATFAVIEGWGFKYAQTLVWHKTNPVPLPGSVTLKDVEFLLAARRGRVGQVYGARSSVLSAPVRAHSAKPEAFLDLIEQVSPGPYLELFARRNRLGWDTWGNEALPHVAAL